jgi:hypothetical protein
MDCCIHWYRVGRGRTLWSAYMKRKNSSVNDQRASAVAALGQARDLLRWAR